MEMKLIIAEKPSLARNIVAGIESFNDYKMRRGDGFFYGGEYLGRSVICFLWLT